ncbi:MAG TPA: class I SAM-dependent methyltransferase [Acidimicrobiales bacterium]|nr:class I SAM-dependent methyltransferase [Acidimicrobiales bacterium]
MSAPCPSCGAGGQEAFHSQRGIPTNSCLLLPARDEALAHPRGDLELAFCPSCGFVSNTAFDPSRAEYSGRYEETQAFSPRFAEFSRSLAKRWVEEYGLHDRTVLEIGCGKGEFLVHMAEAGLGRGTGIDPGTDPGRIDPRWADRLSWIVDFYSERYAHLAADAIVCRHTLEHIAPVGRFVSMLRRTIGDRLGTVVLFELPDVQRVLDEVAFWDVYYEHCSYFTAASLASLFARSGFEVVDVSYAYDDQYLLLEARPATGPTTSPVPFDARAMVPSVERFAAGYAEQVARWAGATAEVTGGGGRVVIWGAGSKGVAFLNAPGIGANVDAAVDINPYKAGMFMAGTGHPIVAPDALVDRPPDLVVVMNPAYVEEITGQLAALGLSPRVEAV